MRFQRLFNGCLQSAVFPSGGIERAENSRALRPRDCRKIPGPSEEKGACKPGKGGALYFHRVEPAVLRAQKGAARHPLEKRLPKTLHQEEIKRAPTADIELPRFGLGLCERIRNGLCSEFREGCRDILRGGFPLREQGEALLEPGERKPLAPGRFRGRPREKRVAEALGKKLRNDGA